MRRKDCENAGYGGAATRTREGHSGLPARAYLAAACVVLAGSVAGLQAGTIRLWPTAVVVEEQVRIHDICELRGFSAEAEKELSALVVGDSPAAGGSRLVHLDVVRSALVAAGANLAQVIVGGSTQCAISRPAAAIKLPLPSSIAPASPTNRPMPRRATESHDATVSEKSDRLTLRQCVIDHFNGEFARYRGAAEVIFDRTSDKVLDLSGPAYEFRLRRRGEPLGLCPLEVDVLANGKIVQTVPFVVQVAMIRNALVARRTVNLDATITAADVDLCSLTFTRLDRLGLDDAATAIGQRAKKVIPAGALIEAATLESVPLVVRGQLVTLTSAACGVRVVTTGKAGADGRLGELIKVRSVDDKRAEFDAVVVGPGEVRLGAVSDEASGPQLAVGERP